MPPKGSGAVSACVGCGLMFQSSPSKSQRFHNIACYRTFGPRKRPRAPRNTADTFWARVNKSDDCWLWTGKAETYGYGLFCFKSQQ